MKFKKILVFFSIIGIALSSVGCQKKEDQKQNSSNAPQDTQQETPKVETEPTTDSDKEKSSNDNSSEGKNEIKKGTWEGDTFSNTWLNIKFKKPESLTALSEEELKEYEKKDTTFDFILTSPEKSLLYLSFDNLSTEKKEITEDSYFELFKESIKQELSDDENSEGGKKIEFEKGEKFKIAGEDYFTIKVKYTGDTEPTMVSYFKIQNKIVISFMYIYNDEKSLNFDEFLSTIEKAKTN
ncbi:MAG: hypothetical protein LBT82_03230 [Oscillospiraceae bacterium]|jgi:hypothetical protein|nr:hypothetical protein [Oscillospiraceae bacterium]